MAATSLSITNPLVKYRALVATKQVVPDQAQFRLAIHLQKLYDRLKDYEPRVEYSTRLDQISRAVRAQRDAGTPASSKDGQTPSTLSTWRSFWAAKERRDSLALTRRLTNHEAAMELTSPKGLMVHGEVGTGKSMLIDLFADCLPNRKKRRSHFNTFMLETFAKLEAFRRERTGGLGQPQIGMEDDYSLLWLAKDMVQSHPILFLDEFQMPDRVASKILTNLMTSFFHLGGVLVATSNRMPEELAKAAGMDFPAPATSRMQALGRQFWSRRKSRSDALFGGENEFSAFLDVLKARCEVWEMEGGKDYRRIESGSIAPVRPEDVDRVLEEWRMDGHEDLQHEAGMPGWPVSEVSSDVEQAGVITTPRFYDAAADPDSNMTAAIASATGETHLDGTPWQVATMKVYGRSITIPQSYNGVMKWTFDEICKGSFGPADYITLASTYHTVILTNVPIITWIMKNEARRFITLLDALYECKCKLYISAAAGPDDLFFPDNKEGQDDQTGGDSVYSETLSEVYQDSIAPFRPNILSSNPNYAEPDPEPDYTHARLAGLLKADAIEDDPPNKPQRSNAFGRSFGRTDAEMERGPIDPDDSRYTAPPVGRGGPDFGKTSKFTGEDEMFAYKRAQSRLWEMCGARWWARAEQGWHRPLPVEVRRWEKTVAEQSAAAAALLAKERSGAAGSDIAVGEAVVDESRDERSFRQRTPPVVEEDANTSPWRNSKEAPPKFGLSHIWGTTKWGVKAGAWGQGVEGLKDRAGKGK
ncbi:hypothetical protein LTR62_006248 [Meristemomyces frigidus]|uniref:AAA+ ATPase domain-containing protein n=1 Tax=Meristemomyces frigidus TaxID=1508187 RepID=A0AAN7TCK8_9PEZI|nr:hypothetical protein LTR62_006248 [Meristemomyces frigidus]